MNKYEELFATDFPNPPYAEGDIVRWVRLDPDTNTISIFRNPFNISDVVPINVGHILRIEYNTYRGNPQESIYNYAVVWTAGGKGSTMSITANNIIGTGQGDIPDAPFVPEMSMKYIIDFGNVLKEFYAVLMGWHPTEKIWVYVVSDQHYLSKDSNAVPDDVVYRTFYDADQDPAIPSSKYSYQDHIQLPELDNTQYYLVYQHAWNVGLGEWHYWLLPENDWRNQRITGIPEEAYEKFVRVPQSHIDTNRII